MAKYLNLICVLAITHIFNQALLKDEVAAEVTEVIEDKIAVLLCG
ncbi:MAG: hypothetical protein P8L34_01650 [Arenicellales bacterium]|nr:hypothetical protein [Arenicellales bacterium]